MTQRSPLLLPNDLPGKKKLLGELEERLKSLEANRTADNEADIYQLQLVIPQLKQIIQKDEDTLREAIRKIHAN